MTTIDLDHAVGLTVKILSDQQIYAETQEQPSGKNKFKMLNE